MRAQPAPGGRLPHALGARLGAMGSVAGALRAVEVYLLRGGGQQTARRNAWAAVCEDRRRARDRSEAQTFLARTDRALPDTR